MEIKNLKILFKNIQSSPALHMTWYSSAHVVINKAVFDKVVRISSSLCNVHAKYLLKVSRKIFREF